MTINKILLSRLSRLSRLNRLNRLNVHEKYRFGVRSPRAANECGDNWHNNCCVKGLDKNLKTLRVSRVLQGEEIQRDIGTQIIMNKEIILENTCNLFWQRGCKSVTMDDVADENGISKRTLYELFVDKAHLLEECLDFKNRSLDLLFDQHREASKNVLELMIIHHNYRSKFVGKMGDAFYVELKKYYPEVFKRKVLDLKDQNIDKIERLLLQGQYEGVFNKEVNTEIAAVMIDEIFTIINNTRTISSRGFEFNDISKNTMLIYCRGLCTDKGLRILDKYLEYIKINK